MAIRINNQDYLNYEEQVLKNKKDVEDINAEISGINLALVGKKDKAPNPTRIKTFTKDDFVTDGVDKVLTITYGNVNIVEYDAVIIDLEGVGVTNGGEVQIKSYMDISLQVHNGHLVTDLAGTRTIPSYLNVSINTPIAKEFTMIKGWLLESGVGAGGYEDSIGIEKTVMVELIPTNGSARSCNFVIHFSNPIYMIDFSGSL